MTTRATTAEKARRRCSNCRPSAAPIRDPLTVEVLRRELLYCQENGKFYRRKTVSSNATIGSVAGSRSQKGYIYIRVLGPSYRAHRLAFLYVTGNWPEAQVDHINGKRDDNRWANLRHATSIGNAANAKIRKDNTTGQKGVRQILGRWQARIGAGGDNHLGTFGTLGEARAAYVKAAVEIYGQFARTE